MTDHSITISPKKHLCTSRIEVSQWYKCLHRLLEYDFQISSVWKVFHPRHSRRIEHVESIPTASISFKKVVLPRHSKRIEHVESMPTASISFKLRSMHVALWSFPMLHVFVTLFEEVSAVLFTLQTLYRSRPSIPTYAIRRWGAWWETTAIQLESTLWEIGICWVHRFLVRA